MQDKKIVCKVCGQEFDFTAGQQEFFQERGLTEPKKCKKCKEEEKAAKDKQRRN